MENDSNGRSWSESDSFAGTTGTSAEWVVEKGGKPFPRWGNWDFTDCYGDVFANGRTQWIAAGTPSHYSLHLLSNSNLAQIATGGAWLDSSYSSFPIVRVGNQSQ